MEPKCPYCQDTNKCPTCNGVGGFDLYQDDPLNTVYVQCPDCMGTGECLRCVSEIEAFLNKGVDTSPNDSPPHKS